MAVDPTKSIKDFKYDEQCKLLSKVRLTKFKKVQGELVENVTLFILQDANEQSYYLTAKLTATQHEIFSGILISHISKYRTLNNKPENLEISNIVTKTNDKVERSTLKIQVAS